MFCIQVYKQNFISNIELVSRIFNIYFYLLIYLQVYFFYLDNLSNEKSHKENLERIDRRVIVVMAILTSY